MKYSLLLLFLTTSGMTQDEKITIAVLPFENVTKNIEDDWLCRGFAEEVTSGLSSIPSLVVVERTQLEKVIREQDFQLSDLANQSRTATVGSLLSAEKLLVGSFQITGLRILVHARVINTQSGTVDEGHQFRFEDDLDNIFDLYSALTHAIVEGFSIKLTTAQNKHLDRIKISGTRNIKAYQTYAAGMEAYNREDRSSLKEARDLFKKAIREDKKFTLARQALANTYIKLDELDDAISEYEKIRKTGHDVTEEILNTLGLFYMVKNKPDKAQEAFQASLALNANYAEAYKNIGLLHHAAARYEQALENFRRADRIDSENPEYLYLIACTLMRAGKQYDALNTLREALDSGFHDKARIGKDAAWDSVRFVDSFVALLEEYFD